MFLRYCSPPPKTSSESVNEISISQTLLDLQDVPIQGRSIDGYHIWSAAQYTTTSSSLSNVHLSQVLALSYQHIGFATRSIDCHHG